MFHNISYATRVDGPVMDRTMIVVDAGSQPFQMRACSLIPAHGHVLIHRAVPDDSWSLPDGRVEPGEAAAETLRREVIEEIGCDAEIGPLGFVIETFFRMGGRDDHKLVFSVSTRRFRRHCRSVRTTSSIGAVTAPRISSSVGPFPIPPVSCAGTSARRCCATCWRTCRTRCSITLTTTLSSRSHHDA